MNEPLHDPIERLLREDARRSVPDEGFSLRVERSPCPARPRPWLRPALVLGSAARSAAWPPGSSRRRERRSLQGFLDLARLQSQTPSALAALGMALAMAVTAAVLAAEES